MFELAIEGGTVVTAQGRRRAHVYAAGGRITAVDSERHPARERVDASGLLVLPGMAFRKFTPPARARSERDLDAMWAALAAGSIDYVATDHAPATAAQKTDGSIWDVHFGLPGIDTTLPFLIDAAAADRVSLERVVEAYSTAPARMYGLESQKGRIAPGADADLLLVDPSAEWKVEDAEIRSRAGWSPFAGRTFRGGVIRTYLRGRAVAERRKVTGEPGWGIFLPGAGAEP